MSESHEQPSRQTDEQNLSEQVSPQLETPDDVKDAGEAANGTAARGRRVLIGSQRDVAAKHTNKKRDWFVPGQKKEPEQTGVPDAVPVESAVQTEPEIPEPKIADEPIISPPPRESASPPISPEPAAVVDIVNVDVEAILPAIAEPAYVAAGSTRHFPPPNIRGKLPPELEDELSLAMGDASLDDLISLSDSISDKPILEPESRLTGRVVAVQGDHVFVELGAREQGIVPLKFFPEEIPQPGDELKVIVSRFNRDDGLYDLLVPNTSASVSDWSDLTEGILVDALVTGHNAGGLECEVNKIRGFIPVSHVALYRVENLEEFVGQKMICLVTEADPQRRNLVLSRRAVLEREKEDARRQLLATLEPGQIHEGVVRKLMDFGAFVDIGGVDGLIHVSQLSWGRVTHPSEVLAEGQTVKVKILKMDETGNRISLGYRDMFESPWTGVENKYPVGSTASGKVSKIMEFGAFVELEPGIEGLVHISELSHKRVWRTGDAVSEGQEVEVVIKSIDTKAQRISLSIKDALPPPKAEVKKEDAEAAEPEVQKPTLKPPKNLKGGLTGGSGGDKFGLNW